MSKINPYIVNYVPKDYGGVDSSMCELDCSLGVNPTAIPDDVMEKLKTLEKSEVKSYPHNHKVLEELTNLTLKRYETIAPDLTEDNLHFGCGSFDMLAGLTTLYANVNKKVVGTAPQFGAYVDYVNCVGATYKPYFLKAKDNYKINCEEFVAHILAERPNLIVCENPNNPTGQMVPRELMLEMIKAAKETDAAIVFDEAYGDYLKPEDSAIGLIKFAESEGVDLIVTRTFSKGFGLAGMRLGYALGPKGAIDQLKKIITPFNGNEIAKNLAVAMLKHEPSFIDNVGSETEKTNELLYKEILAIGKYEIAETSYRTPIFTLYVHDESEDLALRLAKAGICAVSCQTYEGLGKNAVRMMLCDNIPRLIELLKKA